MSSIYDALKRIQGERHSRLFPSPRDAESSGHARRWVLVTALSLCLVCLIGAVTAVVFVEWDSDPAGKEPARGGYQEDSGGRNVPAARTDDLKNGTNEAGKTREAASVPLTGSSAEDDSDAYIDQGERHYMAGEYDKALAAYTQAMRFSRREPRLLNNIGIVMLAKGEPEKAVNYFKQAKSLSGESVEPVYNLACAYAQMGDKNQAISYLKTACTMNPEARHWAVRDPDLLTLKDTADFDEIVGAQ